ncbi:MAG: ABC transporter substrate-binding protein [archaeon]
MKLKTVLLGILVTTIILCILGLSLITGSLDFKSNNNNIDLANNENTIKIGATLALSGEIASYGLNSKEAIDLALQEINEKDGINGRKLEIVFEDTKCDSKEASTAVQKLINLDKITVIIGGFCSNETLAIAPIIEEKHVIAISPGSTAASISDAGDYVFRTIPSDDFEAKFDAEYVKNKLKYEKAAILYCLSDWCEGLKQGFQEEFESLGGKVIAVESFESSSTDLRTQLIRIKEAKPEVIYFVANVNSATAGIKQAKELNINTQIFGTAITDQTIWNTVGSAGNGIIFSAQDSSASEEFQKKMVEKTGKTPDQFAAYAYDATHIIAGIMQKVGTNVEDIKKELYKIKDYNGASGQITLDKQGDNINAKYKVMEVVNGKPRVRE